MLLYGDLNFIGKLGITVVTLLLYPIVRTIYNVFFHPLSGIPGFKVWGASRLPYIKSLIAGTIVHDVEKMHRRYGPVIRIAPNEVAFAHQDAWNDIFQGRPGHLPFQKDPIWWGRQPGQPESLISAGDQDHARMRKLLRHGFTPRALCSQEPMIQKYVSFLIERMREMQPGPIDIVPWFNFTTFDVFGDIGFGESFDCLQHAKYHPWITLLFNSVKAASFIIAARFYPLINTLLMKCIPESLKKMQRDHFNQIGDKVQRRLNWEVQRPDLMSHVIDHNDKEEGMTLGEIQVTFMVLTTAGSETTATVLSGTLNYLIAHPEKMAILVQEVRDTFATEDEMTLDALSKVRYLNAVISEGLRLCPPVPVMLSRLVPAGGDSVCGTWLPAGTSVTIQSYSQFRDPKSFYEALSFTPERWLPEAEKPNSPYASDKRAGVLPFSAGPRSCLGKNLAWSEMRLILARLVWAFDIEGSGEALRWEDLRTFLLVEKKPIMVRVHDREA